MPPLARGRPFVFFRFVFGRLTTASLTVAARVQDFLPWTGNHDHVRPERAPTADQVLMFGEVPCVSGWSITPGPSLGREEGVSGSVEFRDGAWATALSARRGRGRTAVPVEAGRRQPRAVGRRHRARHDHRNDRAPGGQRSGWRTWGRSARPRAPSGTQHCATGLGRRSAW